MSRILRRTKRMMGLEQDVVQAASSEPQKVVVEIQVKQPDSEPESIREVPDDEVIIQEESVPDEQVVEEEQVVEVATEEGEPVVEETGEVASDEVTETTVEATPETTSEVEEFDGVIQSDDADVPLGEEVVGEIDSSEAETVSESADETAQVSTDNVEITVKEGVGVDGSTDITISVKPPETEEVAAVDTALAQTEEVATESIEEEKAEEDAFSEFIQEYNKDVNEITEFEEELDGVVEVAVAIEQIAEIARISIQNGGLDPTAARLTSISLSNLYARLNLGEPAIMPAMESFAGRDTRITATTLALEDIGSKLNSIKEALKNAAKAISDKIKKVFAKIAYFFKTILGRVEALRKIAKSVKSTPKTATFEYKYSQEITHGGSQRNFLEALKVPYAKSSVMNPYKTGNITQSYSLFSEKMLEVAKTISYTSLSLDKVSEGIAKIFEPMVSTAVRNGFLFSYRTPENLFLNGDYIGLNIKTNVNKRPQASIDQYRDNKEHKNREVPVLTLKQINATLDYIESRKKIIDNIHIQFDNLNIEDHYTRDIDEKDGFSRSDDPEGGYKYKPTSSDQFHYIQLMGNLYIDYILSTGYTELGQLRVALRYVRESLNQYEKA